jgi:hypothetical protein
MLRIRRAQKFSGPPTRIRVLVSEAGTSWDVQAGAVVDVPRELADALIRKQACAPGPAPDERPTLRRGRVMPGRLTDADARAVLSAALENVNQAGQEMLKSRKDALAELDEQRR